MLEKTFITTKIAELVGKFNFIRVRYENHILSNTHFIEIVPNEFYKDNVDFKIWEDEVLFDFIQINPSQNICFISDNDIIKIEKVDYELKGINFDVLFTTNINMYQSINLIVGQDKSNSLFIINDPVIVLSNYNIVSSINFNLDSLQSYNKAEASPKQSNSKLPEESYALAA